MEEIWKELPGFEGNYYVSSLGQIKSTPRKGSAGGIMKGTKDRKGYVVVTLRLKGQ